MHHKTRRTGWAAPALALVLGGCGLGGPAHGPASPEAAAAVTMGFESFSPATLSIRVGQTVEWQNTSLITHTVTAAPDLAKKPEDVALPTGAEPFNSGDIAAGQVYLRRFTAPGTYRYFCRHHEGLGMIGTIIVLPTS